MKQKYIHRDMNVEDFIKFMWRTMHIMKCRADKRIIREACANMIRDYRKKQIDSQGRYGSIDNKEPTITSTKYADVLDVGDIGEFYGYNS